METNEFGQQIQVTLDAHGEPVLFDYGGVTITTSRAVFFHRTIPVRQISGMSTRRQPLPPVEQWSAGDLGAAFLLVFAFFAAGGGALFGVLALVEPDNGAAAVLGVFGCGALLVAALLAVPAIAILRAARRRRKTAPPRAVYTLFIETAGGSFNAFQTQDENGFAAVCAALNQALVRAR